MRNPLYEFFIAMVNNAGHRAMLTSRTETPREERVAVDDVVFPKASEAFLFALALNVIDRPFFTLGGGAVLLILVAKLLAMGITGIITLEKI